MPEAPMFEIILAAVVAGVVLFRLYSVLGRKTGHEKTPQEKYRDKLPERYREQTSPPGDNAAGDNVVTLPDRMATRAANAADKPSDAVSRGLMDIKLADRKFESEDFIQGAKGAYEMIVTAFAQGDRATLRPLLSDEVFSAFDSVINGHEERKEVVELTFVGFSGVRFVQAELKSNLAEVTLAFQSKYITLTKNEDGVVIEGDANAVRDVTDIWTFARDVTSRDPNWTLIATSGEDV